MVVDVYLGVTRQEMPELPRSVVIVLAVVIAALLTALYVWLIWLVTRRRKGWVRYALLVLLLRFRQLEFFRKAVVAIVTDGVAEVREGCHTFAALRAGSERSEGSLAAFVQPPCLTWPGGLRGNHQ